MTQMINGRTVPMDLPKEKLLELLSGTNMSDFVVACEALMQYRTEDICDKLGYYLLYGDKYQKLAVLKVIFQNPYAKKYIAELERVIAGEDRLLVDQGLLVVAKENVSVSESIIVAAVQRHILKLRDSLGALKCLSVCDQNYNVIVALLPKCASSVQQEIIADVLCEQYLPEKSRELFMLFSKSDNSKIRALAVKIGKENGYDISSFSTDPDGHIRKLMK